MLETKNKLNEFHSGISHWKGQRISAMINIPLIIWFIFSIISLRDYSFNENINWLKQPINCILITLMLSSVLYHSSLGLQVVIEDYIHDIKIRKFLILSSKIGLFLLFAISIGSIVNIYIRNNQGLL